MSSKKFLQETGEFVGENFFDNFHAMVQPCIIANAVKRPHRAGLGIGASENQSRNSRVDDCAAHIGHGSSVTTIVQSTNRQCPSSFAASPHGEDFGMGARIAIGFAAIEAPADDAVGRIVPDDTTDRHFVEG